MCSKKKIVEFERKLTHTSFPKVVSLYFGGLKIKLPVTSYQKFSPCKNSDVVIQIAQSRQFFICGEATHDPKADHTYTGGKKNVFMQVFHKS